MSVTVAELKAHLNLDNDEDDALLRQKLAAAKAWIGNYTGATIATDTPADLDEAMLQLAAHWYESRGEDAGAGIPIAVRSLCSAHIAWAV